MKPINLRLERADGATVDIAIHPDGRTTMHVTNAPGTTCRALTAGLELAIGAVDVRKMDPRVLAEIRAGRVNEAEELETIRRLQGAGGSGGGWCG